MERVIDPIVTDMQMEYASAVRVGQWPSAAWTRVCGYTAFWKAVGLYSLKASPGVLRNSLSADQCALAKMVIHSLVAGAILTLLLPALPIGDTYSRFPSRTLVILLLPQALPISIPIAVSLAIVWTPNLLFTALSLFFLKDSSNGGSSIQPAGRPFISH